MAIQGLSPAWMAASASRRLLQNHLSSMPHLVCLSRLPHRSSSGAVHQAHVRTGILVQAAAGKVVQRPDERVTQLMELEDEATGQVTPTISDQGQAISAVL